MDEITADRTPSPPAQDDPAWAQRLRRWARELPADQLARRLDPTFLTASIEAPHALAQLIARRGDELGDQAARFSIAEPLLRIDVPVAEDVTAALAAGLEAHPHPAPKDVLGMMSLQMLELSLGGHIARADALGREIGQRFVAEQDRAGILDMLPMVLVETGIVSLIAGSLDEAIGGFRAATRWSSANGGHPAGEHAREFVTLVRLLRGEDPLPRDAPPEPPAPPRGEPGTRVWQWTAMPVVIHGLRSLFRGDLDALAADLALLEAPSPEPTVSPLGNLWWLPVHLEARRALLAGERGTAILALRRTLGDWNAFLGADAYAGGVLRADLADLLLASGERIAAGELLDRAEAGPQIPQVISSRARWLWTTGDLARLDELLRRIGRFHPAGSVQLDLLRLLRRTRLGALGPGQAEVDDLQRSIAEHAGAVELAFLASTGQVPPQLEDLVASSTSGRVPLPPARGGGPHLTRAERQLITELRDHETIPQLAARLHLAPGTIKTRLRDIYRKTGLRSKAELQRERERLGVPGASNR